MKILGIDSSGLVASAAVVDEDTVVAEFTVNNRKTHSQTLLPMIDRVMAMSEIPLEQLDAIAVASGPGSFTGLRIGSSTAKGLGLALDKPIVDVPTLEGLAFRMAGCQELVCPLMDARRGQVYAGLYDVSADGLDVVVSQAALQVEEMLQKVNEAGREVVLLGDGVPIHQAVIEEHLSVPYRFAPPHLARQSAAAVAVLGMLYMKQGKAKAAQEHRPEYLRKSQAEREREERLGKK